MTKTYENGATLTLRVLNPEEPCVSLREIRYDVSFKGQVVASNLLDREDARELALSL